MKATDQMYQRIFLDSFMNNLNISVLDKEEYYNIINNVKTNLKSLDMSIESMCVLVYMQKLNNEREFIMNKQLLEQRIKILELGIKVNKRQLEKHPHDHKLQFKIQQDEKELEEHKDKYPELFV